MQLQLINSLFTHIHHYNQASPTNIDNIEIVAIRPPLSVSEPAEQTVISFIISGEQEISFGEYRHTVQAGDVYLIPFKMPIEVQFKSENRPQFLAINLILNENWLGDIVQKTQIKQDNVPLSGVAVEKLSEQASDCLVRLIGLLDNPNMALAELYKQELIVHLLNTPLKNPLLALANQDSQLQKIKKASDYLHAHWADKVSVSELARLAMMGESSFYQHFKNITGFTPLQYQKNIRLNHAKNLIAQEKSISEVAYQVGYESISQFSREYKRLFGISPKDEK